MSPVRTQRKVSHIPKTVAGCLRVLGVEVRTARAFWLEHGDELDWLLKDAHRAWKQRLISSHPDYNGTHEEAAYWNAVWAQIEKSFRWHGVTLGGRTTIPLREVRVRSGNPRPVRTKEEQMAFRAEYCHLYNLRRHRLKSGIPLSAPLNSWYAGKLVARAALLLLSAFQLFSFPVFADGPELFQHVWQSNGVIFASAHIPACHVARFERVLVLTGTNWPESALSAMTVEEEVFTRIVVFSESLTNFPQAFYRVHVLRVSTCGDFGKWVHACF